MPLPSPRDEGVALPEPENHGAQVISKVEREELEERLQKLQRKKDLHGTWALLGVSPAAVIPALGLLREGSIGLAIILGVLVTLTQGYSWVKVHREMKGLEGRLNLLGQGD